METYIILNFHKIKHSYGHLITILIAILTIILFSKIMSIFCIVHPKTT